MTWTTDGVYIFDEKGRTIAVGLLGDPCDQIDREANVRLMVKAPKMGPAHREGGV